MYVNETLSMARANARLGNISDQRQVVWGLCPLEQSGRKNVYRDINMPNPLALS